MAKLRWPASPPFRYVSRKYEAFIVIKRLEGLNFKQFDEEKKRLVVEIKWKGVSNFVGLRKKILMINVTEEAGFCDDGVFQWNQDFQCSHFYFPRELHFTVFNGLNKGQRQKVHVVGTASLNLAKYANPAKEKELEINVSLTVSSDIIEGAPCLCLSVRLLESKFAQESLLAGQRSVMPLTASPNSTEAVQKVKTLKDFVSRRRAKKTGTKEESSVGRGFVRSEDAEYDFASETDSPVDDDADGQLDANKEKAIVRKSFSYETLASANLAGGSCYADSKVNPKDEGWIYYSNTKLDYVENSHTPVLEQSLHPSVKQRILHWRKRKLRFRSPKTKEEPLLKKDYKEEGGDDIDFDRRQLSSSEESSFGWKSEGSTTSRSSFSEFGDDNFSVGSWESKEVISRDGNMRLQAQVFLASIDQRSERAAGESACTALVAVIAHWLLSNRDEMPIKSEFDNLIREGSVDWRNLCENEEYIHQFPDKHFDLDTVLQAQIRPLAAVPEKSFVGFFHPEGLEGGDFDFLHGVMSFDSIWDEIIGNGNTDPLIYIVSWNDHFFVLKVEHDAYYIIDTLGERLYEGCNQAYILKFHKDTKIKRLPTDNKSSKEKSASDRAQANPSKETSAGETPVVCQESEKSEEEEIICSGKESCKEYIKSFLAGIPIRELQNDIKKGLMASRPLHQQLQIEFHYTLLLETVAKEITPDAAVHPEAELKVVTDTPAVPISLAIGTAIEL